MLLSRALTALSFAVLPLSVAAFSAPALAGGSTGSVAIDAIIRTVDDPLDLLGGTIQPGDILDGRYSYDFTTPDADPSPEIGDYWHGSAPAGIRLTVNGIHFESRPDAGFQVQIQDDIDVDGTPRDAYLLASHNNAPLGSDLRVERIEWTLIDASATAVDSDALPHSAPDLAKLTSTEGIVIRGCLRDPDGNCDYLRMFTIEADVTSASWSTAHDDCRLGTVDATNGTVVDVLHVNGTAGEGVERIVTVGSHDAISISMAAPPTRSVAPFALYFYKGVPAGTTVREMPKSIGMTCMPTPLTDAHPLDLVRIANNIGRTDVLGVPDVDSSAAPSLVVSDLRAPGRSLTIFVQGLIYDGGASNGKVSVTNGIEIVIE